MFGLGNSKNNTSMTAARSVPLVKDQTGASAVSPAEIESRAGSMLRKKTEAATISLKKRNMSGIRAQVMVVLDHSGSMSGDYRSGKVQELVDRFLGFGMAVDVDGEVPVLPFDYSVKPVVNVNMSNYQGVVEREIYQPMNMGSTNLTAALKKVRDAAEKTDAPLFVAIVTDGEPDDRESAREIVKDLSRYPVFIKFLAVRPVRFLEELDDMSDSERLLDNVDTKSYNDVSNVTDEQFADDMADEWDPWITAGLAKGVLTQ